MTAMTTETISLVISGAATIGIVALLGFMGKFLSLPKQMLIVKAALFRILRSNKLQGVALQQIAECQKTGECDGKTEIAVKAVMTDQGRTDDFLRKAALGNVDPADLMKEDETS